MNKKQFEQYLKFQEILRVYLKRMSNLRNSEKIMNLMCDLKKEFKKVRHSKTPDFLSGIAHELEDNVDKFMAGQKKFWLFKYELRVAYFELKEFNQTEAKIQDLKDAFSQILELENISTETRKMLKTCIKEAENIYDKYMKK